MILLGLDISTNVGWALYDLDKPLSAIETGFFKCAGDSDFEKAGSLHTLLAGLIRRLQRDGKTPDLAVFEAPLDFIPRFEKKRKDLGGTVEETTTINPKTIGLLHGLARTAQAVLRGYKIRHMEVRPQTWQTIIPRSLKQSIQGDKATKRRAERTCDMLRIVATNEHKRDAALIAVWASGSQQVKMMQHDAARAGAA